MPAIASCPPPPPLLAGAAATPPFTAPHCLRTRLPLRNTLQAIEAEMARTQKNKATASHLGTLKACAEVAVTRR